MRYRRSAAVLLLIALLAAPGCDEPGAAGPAPTPGTPPVTQLNFGVVSTESAAGLKTGFDPFFADLSAAVGVPVRAFFAPDYAGIIEGMRFGKVDLAWLGNKAAVEAVDRAAAEVFAHTTLADGSAGYRSLVIVHRDAGLDTIEQVIERGGTLTLGNGDPHSTSGYVVPLHFLWTPRGIDPPRHFRRMVNANHEANLLAVVNRQVDAATNNSMNLAKFARLKPEQAAQVRVLWESPTIPPDPLVWRKDLDAELRRKVRNFVLAYGKDGPDAARQRQVLAGMSQGWGPFEPSSDAQLLPIREIELARDLHDARTDDRLDDAQRTAKVAALQRQLEALRTPPSTPPSTPPPGTTAPPP